MHPVSFHEGNTHPWDAPEAADRQAITIQQSLHIADRGPPTGLGREIKGRDGAIETSLALPAHSPGGSLTTPTTESQSGFHPLPVASFGHQCSSY